MDENITITNKKNKQQKIKNFIVHNAKKITIAFSTIILLIFGFFIYENIEKKIKLS